MAAAAAYLALPAHWRYWCDNAFPGVLPTTIVGYQQWATINAFNGNLGIGYVQRLQGRLIALEAATGFNPSYLNSFPQGQAALRSLVAYYWIRFIQHVNNNGLDPKQLGTYTFVCRDNSGNYYIFHDDLAMWSWSPAVRDRVADWLDRLSEDYNAVGAWWVDQLSVLCRMPGGNVGGAKKRKRMGGSIIQNFNCFTYDCLLRAVILGFLKETHPPSARYLSHPETEDPNTERGRLMHDMVEKLYTATGIERGTLCGVDDAKLIAAHLTVQCGKNVVIFCFKSPSYEVIWRTSDKFKEDVEQNVFIDVLLGDYHYTMIDKVHLRLKKQKKFCRNCCQTYSNSTHRCRTQFQGSGNAPISCALCGCPNHSHIQEWVKQGKPPNLWKPCKDCGRVFMGQECFDEHLKPGYVKNFSVCESKWKCGKCKKTFRTPHGVQRNASRLFVSKEDHKCGLHFCNGCREWIPPDEHYCPIQTYEEDTKDERVVYYYDIESRVAPDDPENNHVCVCLVILHENPEVEPWIFYNVEDSIEHMLKHPGIYIAHNGGNYDTHILLRAFIRFREPLTYNFVAGTGSRLFEVWVQHGGKKLSKKKACVFKDSLCFIPAALKRFPKMFGGEVAKGHFPFFLLNRLGVDYVGPKPELKEFVFAAMSASETKEIEKWYSELPDEYNLKEQMTKYCIADTVVLRHGVEKFRQLVKQLGGLDPIKEASTIAGAVFRIFRKEYLAGEIQQLTHADSAYLKRFLAGGRTEVFISYAEDMKKACPGKTCEYIDATSMYPTVNCNGIYPKGKMKTTLFTSEGLPYNEVPAQFKVEQWPDDQCAIFVVDVKCPEDLHIPILHDSNCATRLVFSLRPKKEWGYTSMELKLALQHGYEITRMYRVFTWQETTRGFAASRSYIQKFFKLKLLASGLPPANSEAENLDFCSKVNELYDFDVKVTDFQKNPGLRSVAKLCLNSLWGKFSQRPGSAFTTTNVFGPNDLDKYEKLRSQQSRIIRFVGLPEDQALLISKSPLEDPASIMRNTNIGVGIFTTAQARICLWKTMYKVGLKNVLYCDTDSIVGFMDQKTRQDITTALPEWSLGGWTSELPSDDDCIVQWAAAGPKAYAYKTKKGKSVVKIKGHSLMKPEAMELNNFSVVAAVVKDPSAEYSVNYSRIERPKGNQEIFRVHTRESAKKFRAVPQKRYVLPYDEDTTLIPTRPYKKDDDVPF